MNVVKKNKTRIRVAFEIHRCYVHIDLLQNRCMEQESYYNDYNYKWYVFTFIIQLQYELAR